MDTQPMPSHTCRRHRPTSTGRRNIRGLTRHVARGRATQIPSEPRIVNELGT